MVALTSGQPLEPLVGECPKDITAVAGGGAYEPKSTSQTEQENKVKV